MEPTLFIPPRRSGIIFHAAAALVSAGSGTVALLYALRSAVGVPFVLAMLLGVLLIAPLPLLLYRGYALLRAVYTLERDGLRIRWGLRLQDIPIYEVEWVRPLSELGFNLPLPWLHLPGGILGTRIVPELGLVEFMAADTEHMLLIATPDRVFAISPADPRAFVRSFQRAIEFGSLTPIPAYSVRPAAYVSRVWADRLARIPLLISGVLTAVLFVAVALLIPTHGPLSLGFDPSGSPFPPGPPERLMLLPVIAIFMFLVDLLVGLYFYRWDDQRGVSYLLWLSSPITPLLLMIAVLILI